MLEQRTAERESFVTEVIHSMGKDISKDVSIGGMFIETDRDLKIGDTMTVCFVMARGDPKRIESQVARKTTDGVGVKFVQSLS